MKKKRMKRGKKEIATKGKRRVKREIAKKENNTVMTLLSLKTEQNMTTHGGAEEEALI
jgi:hypothetical protein